MKKWICIIFVTLFLSSSVSAQTVSTSEFKITLIDAIKDYLTSQAPKLEKDELKDLIVVYLITPGDSVDLSKTGTYSGKKLIDTYNKAKGCIPDCTGKCGGESNGCGGTCDAVCPGPLGSKTNPIKLNQATRYWRHGYTHTLDSIGDYLVNGNSKVYFEVDPVAIDGRSCKYFAFVVKGYNNEKLRFFQLVQDKASGTYTDEEIIYQNLGCALEVYDNSPYKIDNKRFLYAVENLGNSAAITVFITVRWY